MTDNDEKWSTETSDLYRQLAMVAVPDRAEQIATLLSLLPFGVNESFRAVELASGEGRLSFALLHSFPRATLVALDGERSMRDETASRLRSFGDRASVAAFDIAHTNWYHHLDGTDCVLSSLCVHHLTGDQKRALFKTVYERLSSRGIFLLADLIAAQRPEANRLFAATWDRSAEAQSLARTDTRGLYIQFLTTQWNYYHYPDPFDKPSPLFDQLRWLQEAGLEVVDCFWMQAGHAIYGGYKSRAANVTDPLTFDAALSSALLSLGTG